MILAALYSILILTVVSANQNKLAAQQNLQTQLSRWADHSDFELVVAELNAKLQASETSSEEMTAALQNVYAVVGDHLAGNAKFGTQGTRENRDKRLAQRENRRERRAERRDRRRERKAARRDGEDEPESEGDRHTIDDLLEALLAYWDNCDCSCPKTCYNYRLCPPGFELAPSKPYSCCPVCLPIDDPSTTTTTETETELVCPPPIGFGTCDERCPLDGKCPDGQLCCSNGCGHACMDGIVPRPFQCPQVRCAEPFCPQGSTQCSDVRCPARPDATCCKLCGCGVEWFDNFGNSLNDECRQGSGTCTNLGSSSLGPCDMVLGVGVVNGRCVEVSGCTPPPGGLFMSMTACQQACTNNGGQCTDIGGIDLGACERFFGYGVVNGICTGISGCVEPPIEPFQTLEGCQRACGPDCSAVICPAVDCPVPPGSCCPVCQTCGGIIGAQCPPGQECVYHPACDPTTGGRDCQGTCQEENTGGDKCCYPEDMPEGCFEGVGCCGSTGTWMCSIGDGTFACPGDRFAQGEICDYPNCATVDCVPLNCPIANQVTPPDACCPICVGGGTCGGIIGEQCPPGEECVFGPDCDPINGGADCQGRCRPIDCSRVSCPAPDCPNPIMPPDSCCPICNDNCAAVTCPRPTCTNPIVPPGECCGVCGGGQTCGGIIGEQCPPGEECIFGPDCDPINGGADCQGTCSPIDCSRVSCPRPNCPNPIVPPGECCGVCEGGNDICGGLLGRQCPSGQTCVFGPECDGVADCEGTCHPVACTADAKQCPDGSFVGRDPALNCDFSPCPPGGSGGCETADGTTVNEGDAYFDGCNTCFCCAGLMSCTEMACVPPLRPPRIDVGGANC